MPVEKWKGIGHRIRCQAEIGNVEVIAAVAEDEENEDGSHGARGSRTGPEL